MLSVRIEAVGGLRAGRTSLKSNTLGLCIVTPAPKPLALPQI